jgi:leucyl-tRNA synthetase
MDYKKIETKWQEKWDKEQIYAAQDNSDKEKYYVLVEFPYPSGEGLHVGHCRSYTALDIIARKKRMEGKNVLFPIGFDAFGLPTENYAIKNKIHPREATDKNIANFTRQLKSIGFSFDWNRTVDTTDENYYKWTQWIFLQFFKKGLAYQAEIPINWCISCKIGLANEEVVNGKCERCNGEIERRVKKQWMLRITDYAQKLLDGLETVDFLPRIEAQQKNWIGKSEGAEVEFGIRVDTKKGRGRSPKGCCSTGNQARPSPINFILSEDIPNVKRKGNPKISLRQLYKKTDTDKGTIIFDGKLLAAHFKQKTAKEFKYRDQWRMTVLKALSVLFYENDLVGYFRSGCNVFRVVLTKTKKNIYIVKTFYRVRNLSKILEQNKKRRFCVAQQSGGCHSNNDDLAKNTSHLDKEKGGPVPCGGCSIKGNSICPRNSSKEILPQKIKIFTTRPDTLFGATYTVLAPENKLLQDLKSEIKNWDEVEDYIQTSAKKSDLERTELAKEKTGVMLQGVMAVNPVNDEEIPIFVADYVLASYGTGAIMAVPAHDERDFEFAKTMNSKPEIKYNNPIKIQHVIEPKNYKNINHNQVFVVYAHKIDDDDDATSGLIRMLKHQYSEIKKGKSALFCFAGEGVVINSGEFDGLSTAEFKKQIIEKLEKDGTGKRAVNFKLRDWIFSRQRYWGEPIPIIHCEKCGAVPAVADFAQYLYSEKEGNFSTPDNLAEPGRRQDQLSLSVPTGCSSQVCVVKPSNKKNESSKPSRSDDDSYDHHAESFNSRNILSHTKKEWNAQCVNQSNLAEGSSTPDNLAESGRRQDQLSLSVPTGDSPYVYRASSSNSSKILASGAIKCKLKFSILKKPYLTLEKLKNKKILLYSHIFGNVSLNFGNLWRHFRKKIHKEFLIRAKFLPIVSVIIEQSNCWQYSKNSNSILLYGRYGNKIFTVVLGKKNEQWIVKTFYQSRQLTNAWKELNQKFSLPLTLPEVKNYEPTDTGESPLASITDWVNCECPQCGEPAKRETDTMPNWAGSSWYFLRYIDPQNKQVFANSEKLKYWTPVDLYNGGMEHTVLHLLYSRFWHKFLYDQKLVPTSEPYAKRISHGMILGSDGEKMSKSRGNVQNPDEIVERFGADTLRVYEMFIGPFDQAASWNEGGIDGVRRFLERVERLSEKKLVDCDDGKCAKDIPNSFKRLLHKTIKKVTEDLNDFHFNTAVSALMIFVNDAQKLSQLPKPAFEKFLIILAPFAPHLCEELWEKLGHDKSIHLEAWPSYDEGLTRDDEIELVVQVNGKLRATISASADIDKDSALDLASGSEKVSKWLVGKVVVKEIFVSGKLVNFVVK